MINVRDTNTNANNQAPARTDGPDKKTLCLPISFAGPVA